MYTSRYQLNNLVFEQNFFNLPKTYKLKLSLYEIFKNSDLIFKKKIILKLNYFTSHSSLWIKLLNFIMFKGNQAFLVKKLTPLFIDLNKNLIDFKDFKSINPRLSYHLGNVKSEPILEEIDMIKDQMFEYLYNPFLKTLLNQISSFKVSFEKINKNIRKYSRKRSGLFNIYLKYVPQPKRLNILLRFFFKDLKFIKAYGIYTKIYLILKMFMYDIESSFAFKLKRLIHQLLLKRKINPFVVQKLN